MAIEIEHKYLVIDSSFKNLATHSEAICQGYLSTDPQRTVRIRTKGKKGYITVKGITHSDSRTEYEYEIPYSDAHEMLRLCSAVIRKQRWYVPYEGYIWEIDEFKGSLQDLVLAEVELPSSDTLYKIPSFAGKNVTGNPDYYNSSLSSKVIKQ